MKINLFEFIGAGVLPVILAAFLLQGAGSSVQAADESNQIKIDKDLSAIPAKRIRNLEIFALVGPDQGGKRDYLTLSEALDKKLVRVIETGTVNTLNIENISGDCYIFIQAGEIVKGGRQDRCLKTDLILPPKSGKQPIGSFCVEHGRWTKRGGENAAEFSSSDNQLVTASQRYAVKGLKEQNSVWAGVQACQKTMSENVAELSGRKVDVADNASPSSLQLALENPELKAAVKEIQKGAVKALPKRKDVIGVAYAINGKMVNAEIYGDGGLFAKQRDKVLEAAATEAIAELKDIHAEVPAVSELALQNFLNSKSLANANKTHLNSQTEWNESEHKDRLLTETRDTDFKDNWCHRNVILADDSVKGFSRQHRLED